MNKKTTYTIIAIGAIILVIIIVMMVLMSSTKKKEETKVSTPPPLTTHELAFGVTPIEEKYDNSIRQTVSNLSSAYQHGKETVQHAQQAIQHGSEVLQGGIVPVLDEINNMTVRQGSSEVGGINSPAQREMRDFETVGGEEFQRWQDQRVNMGFV
jgi:hypothetical protein